jgi:uncharacterized protein YcsI (UPF0317 family)
MKDPRTCRAEIRAGRWRKPTAGLAPGYLQANLVVVPAAHANDFHAFCDRNPRACPLIEATNSGEVTPRRSAPDADLRTDVPRYRIYRDGELAAEPDDVRDVWSEDLIAFLLGCSFSFEDAIQAAGIALRHVDLHRNVSMYVTNRPCVSAGPFAGHMVVSMRPFAPDDVPRVTEISARFPIAHGAPVHAGDPAALGIADLAHPDYGDRVPVEPGEVPVFWACGVTPQAVAARARLPLMITHAPGHMFITDLRV